MNPEKRRAFIWCGIAYAFAIAAAFGAGYFVRDAHPLVTIAVADAVGTIVIFAFSRAFNNSSFYDPYWSVAPMVIAAYLSTSAPNNVRAFVVVALVWAWGGRLTVNFLKGWPNLRHEDWRYINIRAKNGRAYWPVSFLGIHLAPTVWVYLGCLSLYPAFTSSRAFNVWDVAAAVVTIGAIALEAIADDQLWAFRRANPAPGAIMRTGLWKYCRHPNYLGEISFWWGLFFMGLTADASMWWTIIGPLSITALFVFISIPMIDKRHVARRPGYFEHMKTTPALLFAFRKNKV